MGTSIFVFCWLPLFTLTVVVVMSHTCVLIGMNHKYELVDAIKSNEVSSCESRVRHKLHYIRTQVCLYIISHVTCAKHQQLSVKPSVVCIHQWFSPPVHPPPHLAGKGGKKLAVKEKVWHDEIQTYCVAYKQAIDLTRILFILHRFYLLYNCVDSPPFSVSDWNSISHYNVILREGCKRY